MELANSIVTLQPGMYILRHPKTGMPALSISRAAANAAHNGQVQALYTPGTEGSLLRDGKDCIVMQVLNAPVDLLVTAYLDKAGAAVPALKIDKVRLDGVPETSAQRVQVSPKGISIIGHIERAGDVLAGPKEILGKPDSALRIEGFQVAWPDKPNGVELAYSAQVEGLEAPSTASAGEFCGTRNAARRITGVTFTLTGKNSNSLRLTGTAYFSGGFEAAIQSGVTLTGPSGVEHLTALRLGTAAASSSRKTSTNSSLWEESERTRIFKGKKLGTKG